jgi:hypothetical protein
MPTDDSVVRDRTGPDSERRRAPLGPRASGDCGPRPRIRGSLVLCPSGGAAGDGGPKRPWDALQLHGTDPRREVHRPAEVVTVRVLAARSRWRGGAAVSVSVIRRRLSPQTRSQRSMTTGWNPLASRSRSSSLPDPWPGRPRRWSWPGGLALGSHDAFSVLVAVGRPELIAVAGQASSIECLPVLPLGEAARRPVEPGDQGRGPRAQLTLGLLGFAEADPGPPVRPPISAPFRAIVANRYVCPEAISRQMAWPPGVGVHWLPAVVGGEDRPCLRRRVREPCTRTRPTVT